MKSWINNVIQKGIGGTHLGGENSVNSRENFQNIIGRLSLVPFLTSEKVVEIALELNQVVIHYTYTEKQQNEMLELNEERKTRKQKLISQIRELQTEFLKKEFPEDISHPARFVAINSKLKIYREYSNHELIKQIRRLEARYSRLSLIPDEKIYKFTYHVPNNVVSMYVEAVNGTDGFSLIHKQF